jgi:hypothetical protein
MSGKGNEAAGGAEPLTESARDDHETRMTYDPTGRLPRFVVVVWVAALGGLAAYFLRYLVADLRQWGL